jgi:regulator of replication initiation timing
MRHAARWILILAVAGGVAGCDHVTFEPLRPAEPAPKPAARPPAEDGGGADYMARSAVQGDEETAGQGAVDIALEWSKKYATAAEELVKSQKTVQELTEQNKKLRTELAGLQARLGQSQKELDEANEMLVELGKELREWKKNVLGFRDEVLQAQRTQLDAIRKILVLLGGEVSGRKNAAGESTVSVKGASRDLVKGPKS